MPVTVRPSEHEYASFYARYVSRVPETNVLAALGSQIADTVRLLRSIPEERAAYRYAPEKWSIRQIAGHLGDVERVFGYRALTFSRGDSVELPGFDEVPYVENAAFDDAPLSELVDTLEHLRRANLLMFRHLPESHWDRSGIASGNRVTVRALAYVLVGHERHHMAVLKERYLS